ncbi:MAG: hypothetical protein JXR37_26960 [Kiritimatiellae bacterium]|nr:hypothetical protein [Kiritimatiellia bacterium]
MKLVIAGKDRSADLGPELAAAAAQRAAPELADRLRRHEAVLGLRSAPSQAAYLETLIDLLRVRHHADTGPFAIPTRPGLAGRVQASVKRFLWKLLRYQHDRMVFQQNAVNTGLTYALELQHELHQRELAALTQRVEEVEGRLRELEGRGGQGVGSRG